MEAPVDYYEKRKGEKFERVFGDFEKRMEWRRRLIDKDVQFKDWIVCKDGTMINTENNDYTISAERLSEDMWIAHMIGKKWVDMNTFLDAYFFALMRNDIKEVKIKIHS